LTALSYDEWLSTYVEALRCPPINGSLAVKTGFGSACGWMKDEGVFLDFATSTRTNVGVRRTTASRGRSVTFDITDSVLGGWIEADAKRWRTGLVRE